MITVIVIVAIGWLISFGVAIKGMIVGWRDKNKSDFYDALGMFKLSIPFGVIIGWILVGEYIKTNFLDKHFE